MDETLLFFGWDHGQNRFVKWKKDDFNLVNFKNFARWFYSTNCTSFTEAIRHAPHGPLGPRGLDLGQRGNKLFSSGRYHEGLKIFNKIF